MVVRFERDSVAVGGKKESLKGREGVSRWVSRRQYEYFVISQSPLCGTMVIEGCGAEKLQW